MPTGSKDRVSRGPVAALLILLSLFLGSANAAAAHGPGGQESRLASSRQRTAAALPPSGIRNPAEDEPPAAGPFLHPPRPGVVTERLAARPRADGPSASRAAIPRPSDSSYRARAPPAS